MVPTGVAHGQPQMFNRPQTPRMAHPPVLYPTNLQPLGTEAPQYKEQSLFPGADANAAISGSWATGKETANFLLRASAFCRCQAPLALRKVSCQPQTKRWKTKNRGYVDLPQPGWSRTNKKKLSSSGKPNSPLSWNLAGPEPSRGLLRRLCNQTYSRAMGMVQSYAGSKHVWSFQIMWLNH